MGLTNTESNFFTSSGYQRTSHFELNQVRRKEKYLYWDSGRRYYYHCVVDSDGSYVFKGPYVNKVATLLQKVLGDENVLIVKFTNAETNISHREIGSSNSYAGLKNIYEKGICVGFRRFRFFGKR